MGDLVIWSSENWICTDVDEFEVYGRGIIEKCNNYLKYLSADITTNIYDEDSTIDDVTTLNESGSYDEDLEATIFLYDLLGIDTTNVITVPCIISDRILMSRKENDYYILPDNKIFVIVGSDTDTTTIKIDQRFILGNNAYKVESLDNIVKPGLITIKMGFDSIIEDDSTDLGIANYTSSLHEYSVVILNGSEINLSLGSSVQLELECKDNDEIITGAEVTYSLITGSTGVIGITTGGLVSGALIGSGNVEVTYNEVSDSININVVTAATASFTYSLIGDIQPQNEIKYNQQKSFTAYKKYFTGTEVTGSIFAFTVTLATGSSLSNYLLTTSSDVSCTLKALEYPYNITLVATCDAIETTQAISLKGLI